MNSSFSITFDESTNTGSRKWASCGQKPADYKRSKSQKLKIKGEINQFTW